MVWVICVFLYVGDFLESEITVRKVNWRIQDNNKKIFDPSKGINLTYKRMNIIIQKIPFTF